MSVATLERAILAGAKLVLCNKKLRMKDIMEWSTGEIVAHDGEVAVYVLDPGVFVVVKKGNDERK